MRKQEMRREWQESVLLKKQILAGKQPEVTGLRRMGFPMTTGLPVDIASRQGATHHRNIVYMLGIYPVMITPIVMMPVMVRPVVMQKMSKKRDTDCHCTDGCCCMNSIPITISRCICAIRTCSRPNAGCHPHAKSCTDAKNSYFLHLILRGAQS